MGNEINTYGIDNEVKEFIETIDNFFMRLSAFRNVEEEFVFFEGLLLSECNIVEVIYYYNYKKEKYKREII